MNLHEAWSNLETPKPEGTPGLQTGTPQRTFHITYPQGSDIGSFKKLYPYNLHQKIKVRKFDI